MQLDPVLFSGTLRENLEWAAPEATEEQLWRALEEASALFFVIYPKAWTRRLVSAGGNFQGANAGALCWPARCCAILPY